MTSQNELESLRRAKLDDIEQVERECARRRWSMTHEVEVILSRREMAELEPVK